MKRTTIAACAVALLALLPFAQVKAQDPVVIEVAGQQIRQSEFMKEFNNNVGQQLAAKPGVTATEKRAALEEYVELYAIFRAKEYDAHLQGLDTASRMLNELNHYRKEIAASYLIDSAVLQQILAEAYERNHTSLHAAHILVPVKQHASPEDTLKAYNHILELRQRIEKGEDFNVVAGEEIRRRNPNAEPRPIEGDLGYFTVFDMVYPFENAAYALKVGEVSQPVRSRYGYHLIHLLDRVEGLYGKVTMAHIWLHSTDSASQASNINLIYKQLQEGSPFEFQARKSDDRTTSDKGGVLADATLTQLPPEYIHQLAGMKEGEFSKPFFTQYGWHIIKLIKKDTLPSPENLESFYKQRLTRDQRGDASRKTFAENSRKKYGIIDCTSTPVPQPKGKGRNKKKEPVKMQANFDELVREMSDSIFIGKWKFQDEQFTDTTPLVITPSKRYTSLDVARYIRSHQQKSRPSPKLYYVQDQFAGFLDSVSIDYADSQLENEHPDFAQIVNDYRRGLVIFNYNDKMIWRKAIYDTVGFTEFYKRESLTKHLDNPDDSIYFYHPRARVTVIDVADSNALASGKARKLIVKAQEKSLGSNDMREILLKKINRKKFPGEEMVTSEVELVEQTRQKVLSADQWQRGVYVNPKGKGYRVLVVEEVLPRSIKEMSDARGYYLNAWQNETEQRLNQELRKKYNVKIHHDVVRSIKF
ncbi:MAG: peptidylprolyl isomerase [Bacteroidales bacterium]|nr:peptidylprolyl isomerase [Bacteroidales bacterium]